MSEKWKPIDSAPKDGTHFLGGLAGHEPVYCYHHDGKILAFDWRGMPRVPTHWMPLPPPPGSDEEQEPYGLMPVFRASER